MMWVRGKRQTMTQIAGLVLAGGRARRMGGGEKALVRLGDVTLLQRSVEAVSAQCGAVAISANGDPALYAAHNLPVLPDRLPDRPGPLAGILAGLEWAAQLGMEQVFTAPVDTPFLPDGLVAQLAQGAGDARFSIAAGPDGDGQRQHPVVGLWPVHLRGAIYDALMREERRVGWFARSHGAVVVPVPAHGGLDPFFNINTPEDLAIAEAALDR